MGRPPEVDPVKREFLKQVDAAVALVESVKNIPSRTKNIDGPGLHPKHLNQAVGLAFMGLVSSWEEFLELSLVRYLAGAQSNSGFSPSGKNKIANSIPHAYKILSQNKKFDPKKQYLKKSGPSWVYDTGEIFFNENPFDCIHKNIERLKDATLIRNRVAHKSDKCRADFIGIAVKLLKFKDNKLPQGYTVGTFLQTKATSGFGKKSKSSNKNYFNAYADLYKCLAIKIVPQLIFEFPIINSPPVSHPVHDAKRAQSKPRPH